MRGLQLGGISVTVSVALDGADKPPPQKLEREDSVVLVQFRESGAELLSQAVCSGKSTLQGGIGASVGHELGVAHRKERKAYTNPTDESVTGHKREIL